MTQCSSKIFAVNRRTVRDSATAYVLSRLDVEDLRVRKNVGVHERKSRSAGRNHSTWSSEGEEAVQRTGTGTRSVDKTRNKDNDKKGQRHNCVKKKRNA